MSRIPSTLGSRPAAKEEQPRGHKGQLTPPARSPHSLRGSNMMMTTPPRAPRPAVDHPASTGTATPRRLSGIPTPPSSARMQTPRTAPPSMAAAASRATPTAASASSLPASIGSANGHPQGTPPVAAEGTMPLAAPEQDPIMPAATPIRPLSLMVAFDDAAEIDVATPPCAIPAPCPKVTPIMPATATAAAEAVGKPKEENPRAEEQPDATSSASSLKQAFVAWSGSKGSLRQVLVHNLHAAMTCAMACSLALMWVQEALKPINPHQTIFS